MAVEIERKFLLRALPPIPAGAESLRIEQGYLDPQSEPDDAPVIREGRVRRTAYPGGRTVCHHTIKVGAGMVRHETEKEITEEQFSLAWPRTEGQRIAKVRHRVSDGDTVWEIDAFDAPPGLVLAEVEFESEDAAHTLATPQWLEPFIVREVTTDPAYNNRAIARRASRTEAGARD